MDWSEGACPSGGEVKLLRFKRAQEKPAKQPF